MNYFVKPEEGQDVFYEPKTVKLILFFDIKTFLPDSFELPTDLTPAQVRILIGDNPPPGAKLRKYIVTAILNAIFYLMKSGCQWRMLPPHFPKWRTVYNHFHSWSDHG